MSESNGLNDVGEGVGWTVTILPLLSVIVCVVLQSLVSPTNIGPVSTYEGRPVAFEYPIVALT
ncbi:MAG: hypothetical protein GX799_06940 [Crenarchaeota archaeon]|nr:hypothetical protein [Thermoproteota archaeon]